jgi:hypothetical protein
MPNIEDRFHAGDHVMVEVKVGKYYTKKLTHREFNLPQNYFF